MADEQEKTFEASEQKIKQAREKGDIAKSQEINSFTVLFIGTIYVVFNFSFISEHISNIFKMLFHFTSYMGKEGLNKLELKILMLDTAKEVGYILLPLMFIILLVAVISNISQFGFLLNPIKIDVSKMNPINGFKNLFSLKKIIDFIKMLFKFIALFTVLFLILINEKEEIMSSITYSTEYTLKLLFEYIFYILSVVLGIIGIFAFLDLFLIRKNYFKKLMMSQQEIKDEYKNSEGNPEIKQKIRQLQQEMSQRASIQDTSNAKVVITNPNHYAIAIGQEADFENRKFSEPKILAKGKNLNALKIKQIALEHKIEIVENKPLARALYKTVEVGQNIPEEFMQIIFDILIELDYIQKELKKQRNKK